MKIPYITNNNKKELNRFIFVKYVLWYTFAENMRFRENWA